MSRLVLALSLAIVWCSPSIVRCEEADDQYAVAAAHYARQQWDLASEAFELFLERWPEHTQAPTAEFFLGEALVQQGDYAKALERFDQSLARDDQGRFARQSLFRAGESAYLLQDFETAQQRITAFIKQYPDDALNAYALPYLAQIKLEAGDAQEAQQQFTAALERFPSGALASDCRLGLARALSDQGEDEAAAEHYRQLADDLNSSLADDALFQWAVQSYSQGEYDAARLRFGKLLERFPQSQLLDKARLGLGWTQFHLKDFEAAEETFAGLLEAEAVGREAEYWLGLTYKAQEKWSQAADSLLHVAELEDQWQTAAEYHAAESLIKLDRAAEAVPLFEAVARQPENEWSDDALLALVRQAFEDGDDAQIDHRAEQLTKEHPDSPLANQVSSIRARSLLRRQQYDAAATLLESLPTEVSQSDSHGESNDVPAEDGQVDLDEAQTLELWTNRYLLAVAYEEQGRGDQALELIEPLLETQSSDEQLETLQANVHALLARIHVERSDYDAALRSLRHYLAAQPEGEFATHAKAQLAICQARTQDLETAKQTFDAWRAEGPPEDLLLSTIQQMAEAAFVAGDLTWAAERFTELTTPGRPDKYAMAGLSGLAWCRYEDDQAEEASKVFDELLSRFPDSELALDAALARGEIFEQAEQPEAALAAYQTIIRRDDVDAEPLRKALIRAARLHDQLQQDREAAELYARLSANYPDDPQRDGILYQWAWVLVETGDETAAAEKFAELRRDFPQSKHHADATLWLARRAYDQSKPEQAAQLVAELVTNPDVQENLDQALYLQGQLAANRGAWNQVELPFERLIEEVPESPLRLEAEYWLAEASFHLATDNPAEPSKLAEAQQRFSKLAEAVDGQQEPWMAMVALRRTQLAAHQQEWATVLQLAEAIPQQFPEFAQQYEVDYLVGRALASQALFEESRQAYHRVIHSKHGAKTETAAIAQWMIGETYFHQKSYGTALREYLRLEILYAYPTWQSAALLQAGKCHELLGEWEKAAQAYRRIVDQYPQTEFVDDATGRLEKIRSRVAQRP